MKKSSRKMEWKERDAAGQSVNLSDTCGESFQLHPAGRSKRRGDFLLNMGTKQGSGILREELFRFLFAQEIKIVPQARRVVKWPRSGLDGGLRSRRFRSFFAFGPGRSCLAERLAAEKFRDNPPLSGLELPTLRQHDSGLQRAQNVLRRHLLHGRRLGGALLIGIVMTPGALLLVDGSAVRRLCRHAQRAEKHYEANGSHLKTV